MIKSSFTKIGLSNINPDIEIEKQIASLECELVEEHFSEQGDFIRGIEKKLKLRNQWAHPDLLRLFNRLRSHMALVCEMATDQLEEYEMDDPMTDLVPERLASGIYVKSVHVTGLNENLRVTLLGFKSLSHQNTLELKSPSIRLDGSEYPFSEQLIDIISEIETEARLAIYEQKGTGQMSLFEQPEPGAALEGGKKGRKSLAEDLLGDFKSVEISSGGKIVKITQHDS